MRGSDCFGVVASAYLQGRSVGHTDTRQNPVRASARTHQDSSMAHQWVGLTATAMCDGHTGPAPGTEWQLRKAGHSPTLPSLPGEKTQFLETRHNGRPSQPIPPPALSRTAVLGSR